MIDVLLVVACIAIFIGLILVPAYQAFERGRWIWLFFILLGPGAGALWFLTQRSLDRAGMNQDALR